MTKRHFKMIADILKEHHGKGNAYVYGIALDLASAFKKVNPRFNVQQFIETCVEKSEKSS